MRKKTLVILSLLSIGLCIVGVIAIILGGVLVASAESCSGSICTSSAADGLGIVGIGVSIIFFIAASVIGLIAWICGLIKQAQQQEWAWFICTLLFGSLCLLIYLLAVPERTQYVVPAYAPVYPPMQQYQSYQPQPHQSYPGYQPHQPYYGEKPPSEPWRPS
ncbi:MAG TPA: hypothetical protein VFV38_49180 [Ktedonobacteraceae bacterium]|nr:hypothetical protein [Ktedonobacteraceae bacterium]